MKPSNPCRLWRNFATMSRAIAEAKGLETADIARQAGVARQTLYYYWLLRLMPKLDRIEAVAGALGVDPVILLTDPDMVDIDAIAAGKIGQPRPEPKPPEEMLSDEDRAALALGRRFMRVKDHDLLLRACEGAPVGRIRKIAALLDD